MGYAGRLHGYPEDKVAGYEGEHRELIIVAPDILRVLDILPVDVVEGFWKRNVTCALLWMRSMILCSCCCVKGV